MTLSIRQFIIVFTIFIAFLTSAFIYKIQFNLDETQKKIELSEKESASDELQKAIEATINNIKKSAKELSQWQEVKQQINNPEIFAYWYSSRFKKHAYDLQKHTSELMIYNIDGNALSQLDDNTLPYKINIQNIDGFSFHIINDELIYIEPVHSSSEKEKVIGFISTRLKYLPLLRTTIHFQHILPETLNIRFDKKSIFNEITHTDFSYQLHKTEHLESLKTQIKDSFIELAIYIAIPTIILFITIIFLIGRPVHDVALYIDRLRKTPDTLHETTYNKNIKIKELNAIYDSLKKYHTELKQNEEYLALTLNSIGDAVITTDAELKIIRMNPVAESLTGWTFEQANDQHINQVFNLINTVDRKAIANSFKNVIKERKAIHIKKDVVLVSKDGTEHQIADSAAPILDGTGNTRGLVLVFNDITEQKIIDEQLQHSQKMDALGKLTGGIAHDFNNMLGIILGYSELLLAKIDTEDPSYKYIEEIARAGKRSHKLTSKLLAFSRKGSHQQSITNINELINSEQDMLKKMLTVRIDLKLQLEDKLWPVFLDPSQLQDVILNICINAMHAMPNGGKLTIKTQNKHFEAEDLAYIDLNEGDYVLLSITDTGYGMDQETRKKIFDPFFTTKGENGTGLGLSQAYGFIIQSGGTVHVYSEPGMGTKMSIYLPHYHETSNNTDSHQKVFEEKTYNAQNNETILVVDDEPSLLNLTCQILNDHGYQTLSANNANEALTILEEKHADLLLSDIIMPEKDGYKLAEIVTQKHPDIKIQLISGFNEEPDERLLESDLYKHQLSKPFSAHELLKTVGDLLS